MGGLGDAPRIEEWDVVVRSDDGLYGAGKLTLGDGWVAIEAPAVDSARLGRARSRGLALLGVVFIAVVFAYSYPRYASPLMLLALVAFVAGIVMMVPWPHLGTTTERRWRVEALADVGMGESSGRLILDVLVFGWLGLALGSLRPQRWLRFSVAGDDGSPVEYVIDVGPPDQYLEVATKLRSMESCETAPRLV